MAAAVTGNRLRCLVAAARVQLYGESRLSGFMAGVLQPAVFLSVAMMAAGRAGITGRTAIGCAVLGLWGATVWKFGLVLRQERQRGILPGIICRPAGLTVVLAGKSLGAILRSTLLTVLTVGAVAAAAGTPVVIDAPVVFAVTLAATIASAGALGLLLSSVFLLTRSAIRIAETLTYPVFILGGLLVPISVLPEWARPLSYAVSLHWATELLAAAAAGQPQRPVHWILLLVTSACYAVASGFGLRAVLRKTRAEGTLELV